MLAWNPQANEIFLRAVEIESADQRSDFVDQACAADSGLRAEVMALLDASDQVGDFLESPASEIAAEINDAQAERGFFGVVAGAVIGPYKLLELIGEGGMGLVFMAEQQFPIG